MIHYERRGSAALVTIDRPERHNAVDGATAAALLDAFDALRADDADAAMLVLTGAGEQAFCAGADLKAIETLDADAPGGPLGFTRLASPKPTIAAISGHCLAGGFELALWCDLRVATTTATFGCAERRWGVPLIDGGTQRLPRVVGTGPRAGPRPHRPDDRRHRGARDRPGHAGRRARRRTSTPRSTLAEEIAAHPRDTTNSDRQALLRARRSRSRRPRARSRARPRAARRPRMRERGASPEESRLPSVHGHGRRER